MRIYAKTGGLHNHSCPGPVPSTMRWTLRGGEGFGRSRGRPVAGQPLRPVRGRKWRMDRRHGGQSPGRKLILPGNWVEFPFLGSGCELSPATAWLAPAIVVPHLIVKPACCVAGRLLQVNQPLADVSIAVGEAEEGCVRIRSGVRRAPFSIPIEVRG